MSDSLDYWLKYIQAQHPRAIELGLDRVRKVWQRMGQDKLAPCVITVGGTNGKGSTVAFIESIAREAGLRVGAYTSPHVSRYNERVRVDAEELDDAQIVAAFEIVEAARHDVLLTYFEFGTLAALQLFQERELDLVILEVGLGGRLDAVNIVDADVAVITGVDLDHQEFLGDNRESIGFEKAGIMRAGKPCILAETDPPSSVLRRAYELGAQAIRGGSDYLYERFADHWVWREPGAYLELPLPALRAPAQLQNAAAAVAAVRASALSVGDDSLARGVVNAQLRGRLERISTGPEIWVDVAHNPQATRQLSQWLSQDARPTLAVFSALADKDISGILMQIHAQIDHWHIAPLSEEGPRILSADQLWQRVSATIDSKKITIHPTLADAVDSAVAQSSAQHRVLVFGSFHTVAEVISTRRSV